MIEMIRKFKKKPIVIEAIQWDESNVKEILEWCNSEKRNLHVEYSIILPPRLVIETLEGNMEVSKDDWIIKGVSGEFYPCKPDVFEKTYDDVTEDGENC